MEFVYSAFPFFDILKSGLLSLSVTDISKQAPILVPFRGSRSIGRVLDEIGTCKSLENRVSSDSACFDRSFHFIIPAY